MVQYCDKVNGSFDSDDDDLISCMSNEPPYEDEDLCQPWPSEDVATDLAYRQRKS
jgi:hypothetical protein